MSFDFLAWTRRRRPGAWALAWWVALLVGCSGGGVGEGGTGTTVSVSSGPITGFGSVVVGGVVFDDRVATLERDDDDDGADDETPSLPGLQQGMVVTVESDDIEERADGSRHAVAQRIRVGGALLGPVSEVQPLRRVLRVMGLRVRYNASTYIDPALRERLRQGETLVGQVVQVWGYVDPSAPGFVATAVKARPNASVFRARGVVRQVNGAEVEIGHGRFDFSTLPERPRVGQMVRVRADATLSGSADGPWVVRHWREIGREIGPEREAQDGTRVEIEGVVSAVTDLRHFRLNGVTVETKSAVEGLVVGSYVRVRGNWQAGVLQAQFAKLESEDTLDQREIQWEGRTSTHNATAQTFTLTTNAGRTVNVVYTEATRFDNGTAASLSSASSVEVRGTWTGEALQATRVRFR